MIHTSTDIPESIPAQTHLYAKLARVFGKIHRVPKRGRNDFHKYDYATAADVLDAVRIPLAEENIFIFPKTEDVTQVEWITPKDKPIQWKTTVTLSFTFCDGDTGATMQTIFKGEGIDALDKGLPKALTAATKYFLQTTFLVSTGDDPESDVKLDMIAEGFPKPPQNPQTTYRKSASKVSAAAKTSTPKNAQATPKPSAPATPPAPSTPPAEPQTPDAVVNREQLGHLAALMKQKQMTPETLMADIAAQFGWTLENPRQMTVTQYTQVMTWLKEAPNMAEPAAAS
jgi:hypothetical protein